MNPSTVAHTGQVPAGGQLSGGTGRAADDRNALRLAAASDEDGNQSRQEFCGTERQQFENGSRLGVERRGHGTVHLRLWAPSEEAFPLVA